mgnify:CR=1 FL=1
MPDSSNWKSGDGVIEVRFDRRCGVSAVWVRRVIFGTLRAEKKQADIDVLVTGDPGIRAINKRFLKHDYATDVIAFGLSHRGNPRLTGSLVISADFAKRYSCKHGIPFREELARYLVHGTLHLLGYNDRKKKDYEGMHRRQEALLKEIL